MGLFGGSKGFAFSTTNVDEKNLSQSLGDLSSSNIQSGGDVTVNGLWGEDAQAFITGVTDFATKTTIANSDLATQAAAANSDLAGKAIQQVALGYQSAYSETTGMLQHLKPVLMAGLATLALIYGYKYVR